MKHILTPLKYLFFLIGFSIGLLSYATDSRSLEEQADSTIKELYHTLKTMPIISMVERIDWISAQFRGKKYLLGALGEGPNARYDQYPRYRVDAFDCDTYVNTVIALALGNSLESFQQCIQLNRYKDGKVGYLHRNHFTSIDWNKNNQDRGILKDITLTIKNNNNQYVAMFANAIIDKSNWYQHKSTSTIRIQHVNKNEQNNRLNELKTKGKQLGITYSKLPYIPLTALFLENNTPNMHLFSQIPNGAIIEIVRPNWNLRKVIGTSLNISHLGFAIRKNEQLYFREASSLQGKITDVPFIGQLHQADQVIGIGLCGIGLGTEQHGCRVGAEVECQVLEERVQAALFRVFRQLGQACS